MVGGEERLRRKHAGCPQFSKCSLQAVPFDPNVTLPRFYGGSERTPR